MILWDVNLWVYAFRTDSPYHRQVRAYLEAMVAAGEPYLFIPLVAGSFMRIVTNSRIFRERSSTLEAWRFLDHLSDDRLAVSASIDQSCYAVFRHLCLATDSTGNDVPDALLAAVAIRHDARLLTADRRLSRFPGVRSEVLELF